MITKLTVRAFKGLRSFDIAPRRVNLLIGANGTGKTNFADLVAFIASVCRRGLSETIADFGGLQQVRTRQSKGSPYKLQIELHLGEDQSRGIQKAFYSFTLARSNELKVQQEILDAVVYERVLSRTLQQGGRILQHADGQFDISRPIRLRYSRNGTSLQEWSDTLGPQISKFENEQELVLASPYNARLLLLNRYLGSWRVYNVDATTVKQSTAGDEFDLRRDGSNMVSFVSRMLRNPRNRNRLLRDLQEVVPYIQNVQPDRLLTLQTLRFTERDSGAEFHLPEMSDGTIRLLGLLAVLRQSNPPAVMVIEEPENALHAYAIHHFLKMARQVAMEDKFPSQIFLTSHSLTVVDEALGLEAMRETEHQTACFVTQRKPGEPSIVPAPEAVMQAIAKNLGRPSDFQREGSFGDEPIQPELVLETLEEEG